MNFRPFCKNSTKVSELGLGLSQLSQTQNKNLYGYKSEKHVLSIIKYAIKKKINFFDTSDSYGDTERILGRLNKKEKEKIIISTKSGRKKNSERSFDKKYLENQLDKSLKNLNIDTVDIYMLNKPNYRILEKEDLINFTENLKKKGKIRYSGIVIGEKKNFNKIINNSEIDCFSVLFNLLNTEDINLIKLIKKKNKGLVIRSPLNSGILGGNIALKTKFNLKDERSKYFTGQNFEKKINKFEKLKKILKIKTNKNLLKSSLDFILTNRSVSTVLVGCSSINQLKEIISYSSSTKYMTKKTFKKALKSSRDLSKKFKTIDQIF